MLFRSAPSGTPSTYAGGGGGAADYAPSPAGSGGSGGGGAGNVRTGNGTAATDNTGGGGGAGGAASAIGGSGGKGIVVIRYADTFGQRATGGTVTTTPGYYIHTFTGDGTFATDTSFGTPYFVN